jgi:alkylated DNA repair dioxygenase AlkB
MHTQLSLWEEPKKLNHIHGESLDITDGEVIFYKNFFTHSESDRLFNDLHENIIWKEEMIRAYGKYIPVPRLSAWYGDSGLSYTYSKITMQPNQWTATLIDIKSRIESFTGNQFNSVLINLYRNGKDSVSWHSDDEPELGKNPVIASVSFGATRRFMFRHKTKKEDKSEIKLTHGSLVMMKGVTQHFWQHQIPKTTELTPPRINLTFRYIVK